MQTKLTYWIYRFVTVPLVSLLVRLGTSHRAWLWRSVYSLSPYLAGFCIFMEDFQRPENILLWYWREGDPEEDPESVLLTLADIDEMIKRAPVPLGDENFLIMIRQFGTTDKERDHFDFDRDDEVDRYIQSHALVGAWNLQGNRWFDWKKGQAKERLQDILNLAQPNPRAPLIVIGVIVVGRAVARSTFAMQNKTPPI